MAMTQPVRPNLNPISESPWQEYSESGVGYSGGWVLQDLTRENSDTIYIFSDGVGPVHFSYQSLEKTLTMP